MSMSTLEIFVILFAGFVLPFIIGHQLSIALKMKKHSTRFSVTFFVIILCLIPFLYQQYKGRPLNQAIKLGIDLAGGTNLVYQVDHELAKKLNKDVDQRSVELLVGAITKRVNPSGTEEVTVRAVGKDRVEIIVPGAGNEDVDQIKNQITNLGSLEFGILANRIDPDHASIIKIADKAEREVRMGERVVAEWHPVGKDPTGKYKDVGMNEDVVFRQKTDSKGNPYMEFLVIKEPENMRVTGRDLKSASIQQDGRGGLGVGFRFNSEGAHKFEELTKKNKPRKDGSKRRLAAILNGEIHSAPGLNSVIRDSGIIEGRFSPLELKELTSVLNAGALELPLKRTPINEFTVSPLLGIDVQKKGLTSIGVSAMVVIVFILAYYQLPGVIAIISLVINMIMLLGCMSLINATFTLPGLAGIVLTIGMAVDANVLIYERMREEVNKGSSLRLAIQNGFEKAWGTIFDSNITTLLTAWILYYVGTEQIKGFAITLMIGIVTSIFSAVYIGHLLFDIFEQQGIMKKLNFINPFGVTNFKFLQLRYPAIFISIVVLGIGLVTLFARGINNMDIDFTGGSMVTFKFEKEPDIDIARKLLSEKIGSNISLERLVVSNETEQDKQDKNSEIMFRLRTSKENEQEVKKLVEEAFRGTDFSLKKTTMDFTPVGTISAKEEKPDAEKKEDTAKTDDPNIGGAVSDLTFSDELKSDTIEQKIVANITEVQEEEKAEKKLEKIASLMTIKGKSGSGMEAKDNSIKRFKSVEITTNSAISADLLSKALSRMKNDMATTPLFDEVNTFDSAVASDTQVDALKAIGLSLVMIIFYVWFRFESLAFGLGAVVALIHDVIACIVAIPIAAYLSGNPIGQILMFEDFKINLTIVAAVLTVVGYSINDTIVIFDRIREVRGKSPKLTEEMIDLSMNQTLSRTILTTLTVFMVVVILYLIGGEGIHAFAFCMVVGCISGTYSSVYIAAPVVLWAMSLGQNATVNKNDVAKAQA